MVSVEPTFGRWPVLVCGILHYGLSFGLPVALSTMFLDWQHSFGSSRSQTAAVHSTCVGLLYAAGIVPGYMMIRFGSRLTFLLGTFLAFSGTFLGAFATSIEYLVGTVGVIAGMGFCMAHFPCIPCVLEVHIRYQSLIIAFCTIGGAITCMILPFLYTCLVDFYTWRGAFLIISGLVLNTGVTGLVLSSKAVAPSPDLRNETLENDQVFINDDHGCSLVDRTDGNTKKRNKCTNSESTTVRDENKYVEVGEKNPQTEDAAAALMTPKAISDHFLEKKLHLTTIFPSKWAFIRDPLFILFILNIPICLSSSFSLMLLLMDFSKTKGFHEPSTGVLFITVVFISSLVGRLVAGLVTIAPCIHSFLVYTFYAFMASLALLLYVQVSGYVSILVIIVLHGFSFGGLIALAPKCLLDLDSIDGTSFPLALGITFTVEGVADILNPIFVGYLVDRSGSYALPLRLLGSASLGATVFQFLGFCVVWHRKQRTCSVTHSHLDKPVSNCS